MKKFITALLCLMTIFTPAALGEIYTYDETETIMTGVQLRHIRRFYGDRWLNINCVTADLSNPRVKLDLLKNENADALMTIDGFAGTQTDVLAAANADFFDNTKPKTAQGFSLGIEIKDGELLQSQVDENMAAGFYDGNSLVFSYMKMNIAVTAPNGESIAVKHLNKHTSYYGDVLMYTSEWNGGNSPAAGGEVVEVVVENDVITDIRRNMPSVKIPENGYVLAVSEGSSMFFANNTNVGDALTLKISAVPDIENIQTAFGGGTLLLKNGQIQKFTHNAAGNNPRTCIGTNADGTVVYIITVDGRQHLSKGVTQTELAEIAKELGCTEAMNLDGGGSTRMVAETFWNSELHTVNTPTENRRVINAVAITSDAQPTAAAGVKIRTARDTVLVGDSVNVETRFYDENERAVWTAEEEPVFALNGTTVSLQEGGFTPYEGGKALLTASYKGNITDTAYVDVIDTVYGISLPQSINIAVGESIALYPEVYGSEGLYTFVYNTELLSPSVNNSAVISYANGTLTGLSQGYGVLSMRRDNAKAAVLVKVGNPSEEPPMPAGNSFYDEMYGSMEGGNSFGIFAYGNKPETFFDNFHYIEGLKKLRTFDSYGFLGDYDAARLPSGMRTPICANSFSAIDKGFALVISLPQSGILSGENWLAAEKAIAATSAKNVIFMTKTSPGGLAEEDIQVFYDYLEQLGKTKNVFVVQPSQRSDVHLRGNVRFINLGDSSLCGGVLPSMAYSQYLRFYFDGESCKYEFVNVFGK